MTEYVPEAVSVSQMAKLLQISRSRLYQLIKQGVLLPPAYLLINRRPIYFKEIIIKNLEVKKSNLGINGQVIIFYKRSFSSPPKIKKSKIKPQKNKFKKMIEELKYLGLENITASQIESAISELFCDGVSNVDEDEILTSVFRYLKCRNSRDNVRR